MRACLYFVFLMDAGSPVGVGCRRQQGLAWMSKESICLAQLACKYESARLADLQTTIPTLTFKQGF